MYTLSFRTVLSALFLGVLFLSGCASGVKRTEDTAKRAAYFAGGGKVASELVVSLNQNARNQLAENLKFDQQRLKETLERALRARNLLASAPAADLPTIEVIITDIRVRSNFNAVMWGFMAGNDHIEGTVVARNPAGQELQRFDVSAAYALGGLAGGQDEARMGWLYETFAEEALKELTHTDAGQPVQAASTSVVQKQADSATSAAATRAPAGVATGAVTASGDQMARARGALSPEDAERAARILAGRTCLARQMVPVVVTNRAGEDGYPMYPWSRRGTFTHDLVFGCVEAAPESLEAERITIAKAEALGTRLIRDGGLVELQDLTGTESRGGKLAEIGGGTPSAD